MKELNEELVNEIKGYYKKYKHLVNEKKELSRHSRESKTDFVEIHFEEEEREEKKRIKKEITKYFTTLNEVASGAEPIIEVRKLRKDHLDFEEPLYEELMQIYKQIEENNEAKEKIDDRLEKEIYIELCLKLTISPKIVAGVFKVWYDMEDGRFPITLEVADAYREIIRKVEA